MSYHKNDMQSMSELDLFLAWVLDTHNEPYRKEVLRRMPKAEPDSFCGRLQRASVRGKAKRKDPYNSEDSDHFYWRSDRVLAEDPNFTGVMEEFLEHAPSLWDDESKKTLEEVQSFLEGIIDRGLTYDDLSVPQKDWLGVIRRKHMDWVKGQGG